MAREFAQIKLSIWADDDWRDLSPDARYLYLTLLTSPTLTHCGTADWRPARIAALNGQSVDTVENAGAEMVESMHIVIDTGTEEVLIRSFIRNDGLMKQPRMAVSMASAHAGVASRAIRGVLVYELQRLRRDFPDLSGWEKDKAMHILSMEPIDPATFPLVKGRFRGPFTPGLGETQRSVSGSVKGSPTPSPTPSPTTADSRRTPSTEVAITTAGAVAASDDRTFDLFWDAYGKKVGRGAAEKAWKKALTKTAADVVIQAAMEHAEWHSSAGTEPRFIPHPTTWLNEERWSDERGTPASQRRADGDIDWDAAFVRAQARDEGKAS